MMISVVAAFFASGFWNAGTPFDDRLDAGHRRAAVRERAQQQRTS